MASSVSSPPSSRLHYLDWLRGLAAVIMLNGHTFHSFTQPSLRDGSVYILTQFVGGLPPAMFLFLTGITLAFKMHSSDRKGLPPGQKVLAALGRARYLLVIAILFRLQLWVFALPNGSWRDIFRVDILNCMALAVAAVSAMALFSGRDRIRLSAAMGVLIALASPVVAQVDWAGTPGLVRDHLAPHGLYFGFFPWASFLAFGVSAGAILRVAKEDQIDRLMQWGAILGGMLIVGGRYFANIPYSIYPKSDFWIDGPLLIFIKLGVLLWLLTFAFVWTRYATGDGWSWIRQFGTTSLLVYWVHVELVYGRWFWFWKENLNTAETVMATVFVILSMLGLSVLKTRKWKGVPQAFSWRDIAVPQLRPQRVSGD